MSTSLFLVSGTALRPRPSSPVAERIERCLYATSSAAASTRVRRESVDPIVITAVTAIATAST